MSTAERDLWGQDGGRIAAGGRMAGGREIAPLYKRLPKGPHGIAPEDVIHHQRIRMHGAMIEAVAGHGYERTSVKHIIGLAGVSRRAFYEQFANKEDCFMETFDLIVNRTIRRVNGACRASDGALEKRMRTGLRALVEELETNPKAMHLVLIDALTAGSEGQSRLRRALAASEQLLAGALHSPPGEHSPPDELPPPGPLVRAAVGGMRRAIFARLRDGRLESRSVLSGEMLRWTLLFATPATATLQLRPATGRPLPRVVQLRRSHHTVGSKRARLLESVIDLILREPYEELSAPHIAKEARLSIDTFLNLFESPRECFVAALDMLGGNLLEAVADPALVSPQWPTAVCEAIDRLTTHLVTNPASAVTLATKTLGAGMEVIEEMITLSDEVTTLLTEGAPRRASARRAPEWISGALSHTLHTEVMAGRGHLLDTLSEYISYVVLAPYLGPEQAAQTIVEARAHLASTAPATDSAAAERLAAAPAEAHLGEVGEHDAHQQGDHNDDYQRSLA
jgi:AcrR family transcriptional regulator